jgi:hypothetical protein
MAKETHFQLLTIPIIFAVYPDRHHVPAQVKFMAEFMRTAAAV